MVTLEWPWHSYLLPAATKCERQDWHVANQFFKVDEYLTSQQIASFFSRETAKKKALKMSKLKPRKTNGLWKEKRSCKIFRRTSWIPYPSVIQSCTAITTSVIMPPTRTWTSSPSLSFKISFHPFSLTSPIFVLSCLFLCRHVSYIVYIIQVQKVIQKEFWNENLDKLIQKLFVSNKFYPGIMWQLVSQRIWTPLRRFGPPPHQTFLLSNLCIIFGN